MRTAPINATFGVALIMACATAAARADAIPFGEPFKIPALQTAWDALNQPTVQDMELQWQPIDPRADRMRRADFWRQWPAPFCPFFAVVKLPAETFTLTKLYPEGKLVYPQTHYDGAGDYNSFLDLHEVPVYPRGRQSLSRPAVQRAEHRRAASQRRCKVTGPGSLGAFSILTGMPTLNPILIFLRI